MESLYQESLEESLDMEAFLLALEYEMEQREEN